MTWAFATAGQPDVVLFAVLARVSEQYWVVYWGGQTPGRGRPVFVRNIASRFVCVLPLGADGEAHSYVKELIGRVEEMTPRVGTRSQSSRA